MLLKIGSKMCNTYVVENIGYGLGCLLDEYYW